MRALVECLDDWLRKNRADGSAYSLLLALTRETLKRAGSEDPAQREFDAQQLAAAAERPDADDFDASKRWVERAKLNTFVEARASSIREHFRRAGFSEALWPTRRSPGGKHRATWHLEASPIPPEADPAESARPTTPPNLGESPPLNQPWIQIDYELTPPGGVRPAWLVRPLIGSGRFLTHSWRGLLWVAALLVPLLYIAFNVLSAFGYGYVKRPLLTSDLVTLLLLASVSWLVWHMFIRPMLWLLDDRIVPVKELWVALGEDNAQLELALDEGKRRHLQLVRYSAVCPLCAAKVELRYSQGLNRRQLVGCCAEAPHDHVFSFDRVLRRGQLISTL